MLYANSGRTKATMTLAYDSLSSLYGINVLEVWLPRYISRVGTKSKNSIELNR